MIASAIVAAACQGDRPVPTVAVTGQITVSGAAPGCAQCLSVANPGSRRGTVPWPRYAPTRAPWQALLGPFLDPCVLAAAAALAPFTDSPLRLMRACPCGPSLRSAETGGPASRILRRTLDW